MVYVAGAIIIFSATIIFLILETKSAYLEFLKQEKSTKRYCKNCSRWYCTKVDQCTVPACGLTNKEDAFAAQNFKDALTTATGLMAKDLPPLSHLVVDETDSLSDPEGAKFLMSRLDMLHFSENHLKSTDIRPSSTLIIHVIFINLKRNTKHILFMKY